MKILLIVRHAKSSWKDHDLADHQRPLNNRGKKAAPEMGRRLLKRGVQPDIIISSDARRAMDTAVSMAKIMGVSSKAIRQNPDLYHAAPDRILAVVHQLEDEWKQVMVVGHNPGLTEMANRFTRRPIANIPTAGVVELRFQTRSWRNIDQDNLAFSSFDYPKNR
ncbi:histidine phosphatase family protein [uncultured Desulfosarcina sp.]|uniref:SixA phosphatase family protein n=1 Tax=uncultured Desulfosarcina sp. TaxID=218289 RepID=UPI0029C999CA|nr:histidine phosphatase family protein [uncultured Desulfosarcina sp.]